MPIASTFSGYRRVSRYTPPLGGGGGSSQNYVDVLKARGGGGGDIAGQGCPLRYRAL